MNDRLGEVSRRARGYWFVDGLPEIGAGILFMVLSIPYLLWSLAPQGSKLSRAASESRDVVLILGIVVLFFAIWSIKRGSTFPRSGYLVEQRPGRRRILTAILISVGMLVLVGLLGVGILLFPAIRPGFLNIVAYLPTILGLFLALILITWSINTGIKRFYGLAGVAALASVGLAVATRITTAAHPYDWSFLLSADPNANLPAEAELALQNLFHSVYQGVAIFAAIFCLTMLISGLITRHRYLNMNPLIREAANGQ